MAPQQTCAKSTSRHSATTVAPIFLAGGRFRPGTDLQCRKSISILILQAASKGRRGRLESPGVCEREAEVRLRSRLHAVRRIRPPDRARRRVHFPPDADAGPEQEAVADVRAPGTRVDVAFRTVTRTVARGRGAYPPAIAQENPTKHHIAPFRMRVHPSKLPGQNGRVPGLDPQALPMLQTQVDRRVLQSPVPRSRRKRLERPGSTGRPAHLNRCKGTS